MDEVRRLNVLRDAWQDCVRCELGKRRSDVNGHFVFGEGVTRSILFVGEGPGKNEEREGRPFVGRSGKILRGVMEKLGINDAYITNVVACRSCSPLIDQNTNTPMMRNNRRTKLPEIVYKDEPPSPLHIKECLPRLYEEIYLVDPVIIVSLGGKAAEALTGGSVTITTERGREREITIPGVTSRAKMTEKKGIWLRKAHGQMVAPVEQNEVRYLLIPTLHPAYVDRKLSDKGPTSPFRQFFADIKKAAKIFERYQLEVGAKSEESKELEDLSEEEMNQYHAELEVGEEEFND
jgi:uracil-DNA glycosylase